MNNVLLIGSGKMGSLHKKYLHKIGQGFKWYDPYVPESGISGRINSLDEVQDFSHIIIASPTETHDEYLQTLLDGDYRGKILVEKPGVIHPQNIELLKDPRVSVGMVERFNPSFKTLVQNWNKKEAISIDFIRCSARPVSRMDVSSFVDVGIHDLDLFCELYSGDEVKSTHILNNQNTFCLTLNMLSGEIIRFIWSNETFYKERKICVRQRNCNLVADLSSQVVMKYSISEGYVNSTEEKFVEKSSPLLEELLYFLGDNPPIDAYESHKMFLTLLKETQND